MSKVFSTMKIRCNSPILPRSLGRACLLFVCALAGGISLLNAQGLTRYFYDDQSQLFRALDSTGTLLEYVYDPVGNILEVKRSTIPPSALAVLNMTPIYAPPGTTLRIYGQNFLPTVVGNVIRLNGVPATVLSATATEIVIQVPFGDTRGPLTITTGAQTASSGTFLFLGVRTPVITKVTPGTSAPGAPLTLTIEGTDLEEVTFGTAPSGGFATFLAPPAFGTTIVVAGAAGLPGTYAITATNIAGTSSGIISAANRLVISDSPGAKEALSPLTSVQNGAKESIGFPTGSREAVSAAASVQNGAKESIGFPTGRSEGFAAPTSVQNGVRDSIGLPVGSRESFAALTSVRNGVAGSSAPRPQDSVSKFGWRVITWNPTSTSAPEFGPVTAGEILTISAPGLPDARLLIADAALAEDPGHPGQWTITVPRSLPELSLRLQARSAEGGALDQEIRLAVQPEEARLFRASLVDAEGQPIAGATVRVEALGLSSEFFEFSVPLSSMPDLTGRTPKAVRPTAGIHLRNPGGVLGRDPYATGLAPNYAVRWRARLLIPVDGKYRFLLRGAPGAVLRVGTEQATFPGGQPAGEWEFTLAKGEPEIVLTWFEGETPGELELFYASPDSGFEPLPLNSLVSPLQLTTVTGEQGQVLLKGLPAGVTQVRLTLTGTTSQAVTLSLPREITAGAKTADPIELGTMTIPRTNPQ